MEVRLAGLRFVVRGHFYNPIHERTEGRAPVWGSEFTSKDAALQGGVVEIAATLNVKLCDLRGGGGGGGGGGGFLLPSCPIFFRIYLNLREQF